MLLMQALARRKAYWECARLGQDALPEVDRTQCELLFEINFHLAEAFTCLGRYPEAVRAVQCCLDLCDKDGPDAITRPTQMFTVLYLLRCQALAHMGKVGEAQEAFQCALVRGRSLPADHIDYILMSLFSMAVTVAYEGAGCLREALAMDIECLKMMSHPPIDSYRRQAQALIYFGLNDRALPMVRDILAQYRHAFDNHVNFNIPDPFVDAWHRALGVVASVMEGHGCAEERAMVPLLRAEIAEHWAIEDALKAALLQEVAQEVGERRASDGKEDGGAEVTEAAAAHILRKKKKSGKARRKAKKEREKSPACLTTNPPPQVEEAGGGEQEEGEEEVEECAICFLALEAAGMRKLPCGHQHHEECLHLWTVKCLEKNWIPTCPCCRAVIPAESN